MRQYRITSAALRLLFLVIAVFIALGIWLTGFEQSHWLLYLPAAFLLFAAATGICPGLIINKLLLRED